jgi:acyl-CoA synthetase (NDP forming)
LKDTGSGENTAWQYLFSPSSVAVIGASNTQGSWGYNITRGLLARGKQRLYPVNPKSAEILGITAYPSVVDIPDSVDLAVIVVTARLVPGVLRECVSKGVKTAIIISGGFAEIGEQGQKLEASIVEIARQGGIRFIGPNTMGHANTRSQLSTFGQAEKMITGPVALLSQSGGTCLKIVRYAMESGIAFSKYVSTGNEANLRLEDYLEYLAEDDDTRIIAAYIEGLREGRRFFRMAKEITARKPIVVVKAGGTAESARAVTSHTGALAGSDEVYTAAFRQTGVIRAEDDDELCDVMFALVNCPLPRSNRVGILSIGGGQGVLTAEACENEGLIIGQLAPSTVKKLDEYLSSRWSRRNPVDMAGPSTAEFSVFADILWVLLEDKNIDTVFLLAPLVIEKAHLASRMGFGSEQVNAYREKEEKKLKLLSEKIHKCGKPVVIMWQMRGVGNDSETSSLFLREGIPVWLNLRRGVRVIRHLIWYRQYLEATAGNSSPLLRQP